MSALCGISWFRCSTAVGQNKAGGQDKGHFVTNSELYFSCREVIYIMKLSQTNVWRWY